MILESILNALASAIRDTGFVSRSCGLARFVSISANGSNTTVVKAFQAPFAGSEMVDASPDGQESAVSFFTAGATRVLRQDVYVMQCENDVQLTLWVNGDKIAPDYSPEMVVLNTIRGTRVIPEEGSPLRSIEIMFVGDAAPDVSRFGWDRPEFQYGGYPHRFMQLSLRVNYTLSTGCANQTVPVIAKVC